MTYFEVVLINDLRFKVDTEDEARTFIGEQVDEGKEVVTLFRADQDEGDLCPRLTELSLEANP